MASANQSKEHGKEPAQPRQGLANLPEHRRSKLSKPSREILARLKRLANDEIPDEETLNLQFIF